MKEKNARDTDWRRMRRYIIRSRMEEEEEEVTTISK
jgi:hypothetical protein